MFPTRRILTLAVAGLLLLAPISRVAWAQNVYNTTYFDVDPNLSYPISAAPLPTLGSPSADNTVRMVNPTFHKNAISVPGDTPGAVGGLCAMIYVFDDSEEPIECCGCPISNDGVITLSVEDDLTSNPGQGFGHPAGGTAFTHGVIETVSADPNLPVFPFCDPTAGVVPDPTIREWITHEPKEHAGPTAYPPVVPDLAFENITEEEFLWAPLDATHLANLETDCAFLVGNGTGQGVCHCGNGPENPGEPSAPPPTITTIPGGTFE